MNTSRLFVAALCFLLVASNLTAQVSSVFPGAGPEPSKDDVEEVEDLVGDDESLPSYSGSADASIDEANIFDQQVNELKFSHAEIRRSYLYGAALSLGGTYPWLTYSLHGFHLYRPTLAYGLVAGSGGFRDSGRVDERHFDIKIKTRATGVSLRYFADVMEPVSFEASLGYAAFEGNVDPSGSDDLLPAESEKLRASFRATGPFIGLAVSLTSQWDNGFFIEWTPIATRKTWILEHQLSRDSDSAKKAVLRKLERPGIFGVANIKTGLLF